MCLHGHVWCDHSDVYHSRISNLVKMRLYPSGRLSELWCRWPFEKDDLPLWNQQYLFPLAITCSPIFPSYFITFWWFTTIFPIKSPCIHHHGCLGGYYFTPRNVALRRLLRSWRRATASERWPNSRESPDPGGWKSGEKGKKATGTWDFQI